MTKHELNQLCSMLGIFSLFCFELLSLASTFEGKSVMWYHCEGPDKKQFTEKVERETNSVRGIQTSKVLIMTGALQPLTRVRTTSLKTGLRTGSCPDCKSIQQTVAARLRNKFLKVASHLIFSFKVPLCFRNNRF